MTEQPTTTTTAANLKFGDIVYNAKADIETLVVEIDTLADGCVVIYDQHDERHFYPANARVVVLG